LSIIVPKNNKKEKIELEPTYKLIEAIKKYGPRNFSLLSRVTGIPVETIRYKICKQFKEKGIGVHLGIDYNKLALVRTWVKLEFQESFLQYAEKFLWKLSEIGYLIYYASTLPYNEYYAMFAIPTRYRKEYRNFLDSLIEEEVLNNYYAYELTSCRHLSLNAKYFDFDNWEWKIDWNNLESPDINVEQPFESEPLKDPLVDYQDLLILKELQINSLRSLSEIAMNINMNPRTVLYHFNEHIIRRGIINQYYIKWFGRKPEKTLVSIILQCYNVKEREIQNLKEDLEKIPFTFFDAYSLENKFYLAQQLLPAEMLTETLRYLKKVKQNINGMNFEIEILDPLLERPFTIHYKLFSDNKEWLFNKELLLDEVALLMKSEAKR
jgi:DNA-binding Lrp family transcriptional regulator